MRILKVEFSYTTDSSITVMKVLTLDDAGNQSERVFTESDWSAAHRRLKSFAHEIGVQ
jgi:hypothetical protein